jgi:hypothetical protein
MKALGIQPALRGSAESSQACSYLFVRPQIELLEKRLYLLLQTNFIQFTLQEDEGEEQSDAKGGVRAVSWCAG